LRILQRRYTCHRLEGQRIFGPLVLPDQASAIRLIYPSTSF
jgi:hypothetical protein